MYFCQICDLEGKKAVYTYITRENYLFHPPYLFLSFPLGILFKDQNFIIVSQRGIIGLKDETSIITHE